MSNGRGKINLAALEHVVVKSKKDKDEEIICIPIKKNNLFKSEKGNVYLDIIYNEIKNKRDDSQDTHIINQSVPKEVREALAAQTPKAYPPTLGNLQHWDGSSGHGEASPNVIETLAPPTMDDLPF